MARYCACVGFGAIAGLIVFAVLAFAASELVDANLIGF